MAGEGQAEAVTLLQAAFRPGSRLAGYVLEEQIGAGGMAVVFRALDQRLGRRVALKILAPGLASDRAFRQRFIRESQAAAAVNDPHIIPVFEAGEAAGMLFIAMPLVPGTDVRTLLREQGPLPPGRAAEIISQVAPALDAAHAAGLVHRDVKPANMLIYVRPGRDHVYLADFGISRDNMTPAGLTGTGVFLGTPEYAAPEQIEHVQGRDVDGRADQYALACAAFELLAGQTPFQHDQVITVLMAQLSVPPPQLSSLRPELPKAVDTVFARALAKSPPDRFASCQEFAEALTAALGAASSAPPDGDQVPPVTVPPAGDDALRETPHDNRAKAEPRVHGNPPPSPMEPEPETVNRPGGQAPGGGSGDSPTVTVPPGADEPAASPAQEVPAGPPAPPDGRSPRFRSTRRMRAIAAAALAIAAAATVLIVALPGGTPRGRTGGNPLALAGLTAYVASNSDGTVTPVSLATGHLGTPITVGRYPVGIAITPDGATAYVANFGDGTVTPVTLATGRPGTPIKAGKNPYAIAITPNGAAAYVVNEDGTVTPISLATGRPGTAIKVGKYPFRIAITPNGATAYVVNSRDDTVIPVNLATGKPGTPIDVGFGADGIAITPNGATAYVADGQVNAVTPINLAAGRPGSPIFVGKNPGAIAITPNGATAYVANYGDGTITPITVATGRPGTPIKVGKDPYAITITPNGAAAYVANWGPGTITPVNLATGRPSAPIFVGKYPAAIAITRPSGP